MRTVAIQNVGTIQLVDLDTVLLLCFTQCISSATKRSCCHSLQKISWFDRQFAAQLGRRVWEPGPTIDAGSRFLVQPSYNALYARFALSLHQWQVPQENDVR